MKRYRPFLLAVFLFMSSGIPASAGPNVNLGVSIGNEGLQGFHLSIGEYYRVPEREIIYIRERHIPDPEIPVILFIASRAHVPPAHITRMRLRGISYMEIVTHYHLSPEIFYVPVGPPYGHRYGHFKKPKKAWRHLHFRDEEVVDLVNCQFISRHHRVKPKEILRLRGEGKSFAAIDADQRGRGKEKEKLREERADSRGFQGEGDHSRGRGHRGDDDWKGKGRGKGKH